MRSFILVLLAFALGLAFAPDDAWARRERKASGPLAVGVAPFEGDGSGETLIAEAIELELELVETVVVSGGRWMKRDLRRAGAMAFEEDTLRRIMKKRRLDVLIRGLVGPDDFGDRVLYVYAYGADGKPRFFQRFTLPKDIDDKAREIVEALKPSFERWRSLDPIQPGLPTDKPAPVPDEEDRVDSFFPDLEEGGTKPPAHRRPVVAEPDPEPARPRVIDPAPNPEPTPRRRPLLDAPPEKDDREEPRRTLAELEKEGARAALKKTHWLTLSVGGDAGFWYYSFDAEVPEQGFDLGQPLVNPGGGARVGIWFLPWLGVDADVRATFMTLRVKNPPIQPQKLSTFGIHAGIVGRARYVLELGGGALGGGVRLGYRYWGRTIEPQTSAVDGGSLTIIPGWMLHAATLGAELYGSLIAAERRFEVELEVDTLPLVYYLEKPDNPGSSEVYPVGWSALALVRIPIFHPVFFELGAQSVGMTVEFQGEGDRQRRNALGKPVSVQGGRVLNVDLGMTAAVGLVF